MAWPTVAARLDARGSQGQAGDCREALVDGSPAFRAFLGAPEQSRTKRFRSELFGLLTLAITLAGVLHYVTASRLLTSQILEWEQARVESDAQVLERSMSSSAVFGRSQLSVDYVASLAQRNGVLYVAIVTPQGAVVDVSNGLGAASIPGPADVANVDTARHRTAGSEEGKLHEFVVPISRAGAGPAWLVVVEDDRAVRMLVGKLRVVIGGITILGNMLGAAMFFFLGGRRLVKMHSSALDQAHRDPLTGLENARAFDEAIESAASAVRRASAGFTLVLIDADSFKQINDELGHAAGDKWLQRVGKVLSQHRREDRAFRIGGDEFALLLMGSSIDATTIAERIRQTIADSGVTVSIGIAAFRPWLPASEVRDQADVALYEAKDGGRNRVVVASQLPEVPASG